MPKSAIRILGIDPGSVTTGYGVIDSDGNRSVHVSHGHIAARGETFPQRLGDIFAEIRTIIVQWQPQECAIEDVFMNKNAMSALKLGQARGAAISAAVDAGLAVSEYTPRLIKQSVTGTGAASKEQVQHMVGVLLNQRGDLQADAADGLAVAICHAHSRAFKTIEASV